MGSQSTYVPAIGRFYICVEKRERDSKFNAAQLPLLSETRPCRGFFKTSCSIMADRSAKYLATLLSRPSVQDYVSEQFRQLNKRQVLRMQHDPRYSVSVATSAVGQARNRYSNIIPFNYNRVRLQDTSLMPIDPSRGDDYINASMIQAPLDIPRQYIASQGPIQSTLIDFWRMVIEQDTRLIVALSPEMENGMEKCARYWPLYNEPPLVLQGHHLSVELTTTEPEQHDEKADSLIRRIHATFMDDQQHVLKQTTVTQLQFLGWADFSVPHDTHPVIALSHLADQYQPKDAGPMIVHCSAGCGRTGTFCVINSGIHYFRMMQKSSSQEQELEKDDLVFTLTDAYRRQRTTMVQAVSQYYFCYRALLEAYQMEHGPIAL